MIAQLFDLCHVERSRDISRCFRPKHGSEILRDFSTSVEMTKEVARSEPEWRYSPALESRGRHGRSGCRFAERGHDVRTQFVIVARSELRFVFWISDPRMQHRHKGESKLFCDESE